MAQCVEFYYTYKKQVKIGRNGTLTFGDLDTGAEKSGQEEVEVDVKVSPSWLCRLTVGNTWGQTPGILYRAVRGEQVPESSGELVGGPGPEPFELSGIDCPGHSDGADVEHWRV